MAPMLRGDFSLGTRGGKMTDLAHTLDAVESVEFGATAPSSTGGSAGLHAARIAFMKGPAHFDPREYLGVFSAAVLVEPRLLRGGAPADADPERPPSDLQAAVQELLDQKSASAPAALPQGGARGEVLALLRDWAVHGRLRLAPARGPDLAGATSRVFAVPKSATEDRLVVDRQIENAKELSLGGAARDLPSGSDMAEHWVPRGWTVRMSSEDLTDYFPSIDSSDARAQTNGLDFLLTKAEARSLRDDGALLAPAVLEQAPVGEGAGCPLSLGVSAEGERASARAPEARTGRRTRIDDCSLAKKSGNEGLGPLSLGCTAKGERASARTPEAGVPSEVSSRSASSCLPPSGPGPSGRWASARGPKGARAVRCVVPQFAGLPMGDCSAPDLAAEAHASLLTSAGFLRDEHRVLPRKPFPRGSTSEYLVYDDHVLLTSEPPKQRKVADKMGKDMDAMRNEYKEVGLGVSVKKAQRSTTHGYALGSELLGDCPMVGAERGRRWALAMVALRMAGSGKTNAKLLQKVLSSFLHVLLYRRPLLSILERSWRTASLLERRADDTVAALPSAVRNELALLACLAPVMVTQLDSEVAPMIWATDASPSGLGSVEADMPSVIVEELWRHRDRRGHHSWLCGTLCEYMYARGTNQEVSELQELIAEEGPTEVQPRIERVLAESFDFLDVFCGAEAPLSAACGRTGLRVGPRIDLVFDPLWDLTGQKVCEWILWLIQRRRVWGVHFAPPSGTFSPACRPPRRSSSAPWGLAGDDAKVKGENVWLQLIVMAMRAVRSADWGWISLEHPAASRVWDVPQIRDLARGRGWCHASLQLGPTYSYVGGIRSPFLCDIDNFVQNNSVSNGRPDEHTGIVSESCRETAAVPPSSGGGSGLRAAPPQGGSRSYSPHLCDLWSAAIRRDYDEVKPSVSEWDLQRAGRDQRAAAEQIWVNELCTSAAWRLRRRSAAPGPEHINIKEVEILCTELAAAAGRWPRSRLMALCDSRVACGALAKGRSSSSALNRPLRRLAADLVAQDSHAGVCFVPTRIMPADGPSRGRPVPRPRSRWPSWADALANDRDYETFDMIAALPKQSFKFSEWARFFVKLVLLHRDFDATLGYPGEGPWGTLLLLFLLRLLPLEAGRAQALHPAGRPVVDLRGSRVRSSQVAARRLRLLGVLEARLLSVHALRWEAFTSLNPGRASDLLAETVQWMYDSGRPFSDASELLNAIAEHVRSWRGSLHEPWSAVRLWKELTPASNHAPAPVMAVRAAMSLALQWGWLLECLGIGLMFLGMLRPAEWFNLDVRDVLTHSSLMADFPVLFLRIRAPKMRWLSARREFVRVDDLLFMSFVESVLSHLPGGPIWPWRPVDFRHRFDALFRELRIKGLTPASLRAGGATHLFTTTQNMEIVRWKGRWQSLRTVEHYVQEINCIAVLQDMPPASRDRLGAFGAHAARLLRGTAASLDARAASGVAAATPRSGLAPPHSFG